MQTVLVELFQKFSLSCLRCFFLWPQCIVMYSSEPQLHKMLRWLMPLKKDLDSRSSKAVACTSESLSRRVLPTTTPRCHQHHNVSTHLIEGFDGTKYFLFITDDCTWYTWTAQFDKKHQLLGCSKHWSNSYKMCLQHPYSVLPPR